MLKPAGLDASTNLGSDSGSAPDADNSLDQTSLPISATGMALAGVGGASPTGEPGSAPPVNFALGDLASGAAASYQMFGEANIAAPTLNTDTGPAEIANGASTFAGVLSQAVAALLAASGGPALVLSGGSTLNNAPNSTNFPNGASMPQYLEALDVGGLSVNGAGIKVGVISDSFNDTGGAATDYADGVLSPVQVIEDAPSGGTDEGRAMLAIVHAIAPGASLAFANAGNSDTDFANAISALAAAGCNVICDDVTQLDEPFFQTGIIGNAVQAAAQQGIIYVTCAGNQGEGAYQQAWSNISSVTIGGKTLHNVLNFNGNDNQSITLTDSSGSGIEPLLLQWNQAQANVTSDIAVQWYLNGSLQGTFTNAASTISGWSEPGSYDPEVMVPLAYGEGYTNQIVVTDVSGPLPTFVEDEVYNDSGSVSVSMSTGENGSTVFGHHFSPFAITVGAVAAGSTPAFNNGTAQSESFSSSGNGTELWFNFNGSAVANAPDRFSPVDISGVDGVNTGIADSPEFTNAAFFGTSAATPSIAAIAALMLQENPTLTLGQIENVLAATAFPTADFAGGNSAVAGAGLVRGNPAVEEATGGYAAGLIYIGSLSSETFWDSTNGTPTIWVMNGAAVTSVSILPDIGTSWQIIGVAGFTGSTAADLLLDSTSGQPVIWLLNNTSLAGGAALPDIGASWYLGGLGDFNGDGKSDILWVDSGGTPSVWLMNGASITGSSTLPTLGSNWNVGGIADFNNNGKSDILWYSTGGTPVIWMMNGTSITSSATLPTLGPLWSPLATGNFAGTGNAGILWEDTGGTPVMWLMNGTTVSSSSALPTLGTNWQFRGTGDFDGDGKTDILWQSSAGNPAIWLMNGTTVAASAVLPTPGPAWTLLGSGMFSGNGKSDLLWEDSGGSTVVWFMNGTQIVSGQLTSPNGVQSLTADNLISTMQSISTLTAQPNA